MVVLGEKGVADREADREVERVPHFELEPKKPRESGQKEEASENKGETGAEPLRRERKLEIGAKDIEPDDDQESVGDATGGKGGGENANQLVTFDTPWFPNAGSDLEIKDLFVLDEMKARIYGGDDRQHGENESKRRRARPAKDVHARSERSERLIDNLAASREFD